ncbi:uncharacterized protein LOC142564553 isoform X2 [Dermacentor variabilis]|uniref:uncharacterized protein LOC142564553 isoform X2 n=1 Tax=Dermacentor variabilis TaxID=34621 RepID=UPI003F5BCD89
MTSSVTVCRFQVNVFVVRFEAPFLRRLILRLSKAEASTAEDVMEKAGGLAASAGHTVMRLFSAFMKGMHKKMEESRHHTPHETSRADRPRHARILKMPCPSTPKLSLLRSKHSLTNTTSWKLLLLA